MRTHEQGADVAVERIKTIVRQHEQPVLCRASAEVFVRFVENRI
jgi:hypothetical protein